MSDFKLIRYRMDPKGKAAENAAGLMGIGMFLRIVYFFALTRLESAGAFLLIFGLILPLIAEVAFIVMIKGLRLNNPWLYAIVGAFLCLVLLVLGFQYGNVLRLVLAILLYLAGGGALVAMVMGFLPNKAVKWGFIGVAAGRLVFFNIVQNVLGFHPVVLVFEVAAMFELLALGCFAATLTEKKKK